MPEASTLLLSLGESASTNPRWRIYCSPTAHGTNMPRCEPPALPAGITLDDLQLSADGSSAIGILIRMRSGSAWTQRGMNVPSANVEWQLASDYVGAL